MAARRSIRSAPVGRRRSRRRARRRHDDAAAAADPAVGRRGRRRSQCLQPADRAGRRRHLAHRRRRERAARRAGVPGPGRRSREMVAAASSIGREPIRERIRAYMVAGNVTMMHLLLGEDPSGIRRVPSEPRALAFEPVLAATLGWPGGEARPRAHRCPAAGGWVGGDIVAGVVRAGLLARRRAADALRRPRHQRRDRPRRRRLRAGLRLQRRARRSRGAASAAACGPTAARSTARASIRRRGAARAVRHRRRAARGRVRVGPDRARRTRCSRPAGSTAAGDSPDGCRRATASTGRRESRWRSTPLAMSRCGSATSRACVRAKAAIFAGIRSLRRALWADGAGQLDRVIVSGQLRPLPQPAGRDRASASCRICRSGATATSTTARSKARRWRCCRGRSSTDIDAYLQRITYVDLSDLPGYMDEFVGASFLPHTSPELLQHVARGSRHGAPAPDNRGLQETVSRPAL